MDPRWAGTAPPSKPKDDVARVRVAGTWVEPLSVEVDGWAVATLYPDQRVQVRARAGASVVLRTETGAEAARWRIRSGRLAVQSFEQFTPATAGVTVHNPCRRPLMVVDASTGQRLGRVLPGRSRLFQLPSGRSRSARCLRASKEQKQMTTKGRFRATVGRQPL